MASKPMPINFANAAALMRPLFLLVGLAAAVAVGLGLFTWARGTVYAPLYSGLGDKAAAEVTAALDAAGVAYKLGPGAGQVRVAEARLTEARLALASQGLPSRNDTGLEFMNEGPSLGVSQFVENARYQHALETELARTISSIRQVSGARVHLAVPKASAFARDRREASASVMLETFPGAVLDAAQVQAIVNLVATGIPNLDPKRVSVVDQTGRLLSSRGGDTLAEAASTQFQLARKLEGTLAQRIEQLLLPMTGAGRFSVQVHADMDFTQSEEASETFKPDGRAVRSERISETGSGEALAAGVPGAASNQPEGSGASQPAASVDPAQTGGSRSRSQSRDYELDRAVSYTRNQVGQVKRLTVAVLVDDLPRVDAEGNRTNEPLGEEALQRITGLVRDAIGYDAERGDSVTVLNASFMPPEETPALDPRPLWELPWVRDFARNAVGVVALLALVFGVLRPVTRQILNAPVLAPAGGPRLAQLAPPAELVDEDRATLRSGNSAPQAVSAPGEREAVPYEQRLQVARDLIRDDPKRVAQVVRNWVQGDG